MANIVIVIAYFSIPIGLIYFVRHRKDLPINWMFVVYAAFILSCAITHAMHALTYFYGLYYLQTAADVATAIISFLAAIATVFVIPLALKIPNPQELADAREESRMKQFALSKQQEVDQERSEFISSASHELRTPLATQLLTIDLMEEVAKKNNNTESLEYVSKIRKQADKLSSLIHDLSDAVFSEGHRIVSDFSPVDLNTLIREAAADATLLYKHPIDIKGSVSRPISADRERITQVLMNLVSNAANAPITISVAKRGEDAEIKVIDRGIGIDSKYQKKIFERWFRVAGSSQKFASGMGVGLFLCSEIVKSHGGEIRCESTPHTGTTFTFTIPFVIRPEDAARFEKIQAM